MTLPNFLILGTAKAGTSSLASYLDQHPQVCFASAHEPNYFAFDSQFRRGPDYYRSLFSHCTGESVAGEKSWRYACHEVYPEAFARIRALLPALRLIFVLRDPLPRGIQMWRELRDAGQDIINSDPEKALLTNPLITDSMRYASTYRRWAGAYGEENVKIVFFEDLVANPNEFYRSVTDFIGVAPLKPEEDIHENPSEWQRSDRIVLEWLRRKGFDQLLHGILPYSLRALGRKHLKRPIGEVRISDETRRAFLDMVRSEAQAALRIAGKPANFWALQ